MSNKSRVEEIIKSVRERAYGAGYDGFFESEVEIDDSIKTILKMIDQEREKAAKETEARVRYEIGKQAPDVTNKNWEDYDRFINSIWLFWAIENNIKYDSVQDKFVPSELKTGNREEA